MVVRHSVFRRSVLSIRIFDIRDFDIRESNSGFWPVKQVIVIIALISVFMNLLDSSQTASKYENVADKMFNSICLFLDCIGDPSVVQPFYDDSDVSYESDSSQDIMVVQKSEDHFQQ